MVDLSVKLGPVGLKNPIMPASGCFSSSNTRVFANTSDLPRFWSGTW